MANRFESLLQKQQIRIAELEKMVFGFRPTAVPPQRPSGSNGEICNAKNYATVATPTGDVGILDQLSV